MEENWFCQLEYVEDEEHYKFSTRFKHRDWKGANKISFFFDKKGKYIEKKAYVSYAFKNSKIEKTENTLVRQSIPFKEQIEKCLKELIASKNKEKIKIIKEQFDEMRDSLYVKFEFEKIRFDYFINFQKPLLEKLECVYEYKSECEFFMINLKNIPMLKEVKQRVRNHPKLRVKYVNELAGYDLLLSK